MVEKPLLLYSAKSGIIVGGNSRSLTRWLGPASLGYAWVRPAFFLIGALVIVVGASDVLSRVSPDVSGDTATTAFGPGILALEPGALTAITGATTSAPFVPTKLIVPSLSIDASVEQVGVKDNGQMANPSGFTTVGWYKHGAKAGEEGNAVIAGHVNNGLGLSGVFARLNEVAIGQEIIVRGEGGKELRYTIVQKSQFMTQGAPLDDIFRIVGPSGLVLITCEGDWDPSSRSYDRRLVVTARLNQ